MRAHTYTPIGSHTHNASKEHPRACLHTHTHTAEKGWGVKTNSKARVRRAVVKSKRESAWFVQQKSCYWSKHCFKRWVWRLVLKAGRDFTCGQAGYWSYSSTAGHPWSTVHKSQCEQQSKNKNKIGNTSDTYKRQALNMYLYQWC